MTLPIDGPLCVVSQVLAFACAICTVILPVQSGDLVQTTDVFLHICQVMDHLYGLGREECFYEECVNGCATAAGWAYWWAVKRRNC